jgi:hypothetical protein
MPTHGQRGEPLWDRGSPVRVLQAAPLLLECMVAGGGDRRRRHGGGLPSPHPARIMSQMGMRPPLSQRKFAAAGALTVCLLLTVSGLAVAQAVTSDGRQSHAANPRATDRGKQSVKKVEKAERHDDHAGGPPKWTHGYAVSKVAHETPPGPGHGKAVSAAARSWGGKQHSHPRPHGRGRPDDD